MNRVLILLMFTILFSSCTSSSKLMRRGNYDAAIAKSVRKLAKNPNNQKEIITLERAYNIANEQNQERIRFLKRDSNPRNMVELLDLYALMSRRQTLVRTVTPLNLPNRVVQFPYIDYDEEIISAKQGATEFLYEEALQLMRKNEKLSFRNAWQNLSRVKEMAGGFRNVDDLLAEAREKGMSRVLVSVNNRSHLNLHPEFVDQLLIVDTRRIDNEWVEFYYKDLDEQMFFDYFVVINLLSINVSENQVKEKDQMVRKRVEDGFEYLLDGRGNVRKDSLGNDIRVQKYKDLACSLVETEQLKTVSIDGNLELYSEQPRRLLKREPLGAATEFKHFYARAIGDLDALDDETRKMVETKPLPFPTEAEMVFRTSETLKVAIAEAIRKNRRLIN